MESHCPKLQNMVKFVEKKILRHTDIVSQRNLWFSYIFTSTNFVSYKKLFFL